MDSAKEQGRSKMATGLIVHEWVEKAGGAEKVVDQLVEAFPDADLQVLWTDHPERYTATTYETWLARTPLRRNKALALPLMPSIWRNLRNSKSYDWLLVSSHLFAHHVKVRFPDEVPKLVYAHTPARYIWAPELDRRGSNPIVRLASGVLRPLDRWRAREATAIAANSEFTRARVEAAWKRPATVIYPPVDVARIAATADWATRLDARELTTLSSLPDTFLLGASRFVPYKRLDLVIRAGEATGLPVVLAGSGPAEQPLRELAATVSVPVSFVRAPSDAMLYSLYQRALAYVFPAVEDFGIMPVEAMAAGAPVVVPATGGAAESASLVGAGAYIEDASPQGWRNAIDEATQLDRTQIAARAMIFSNAAFRQRIASWVVEHASG